MNKTAIDMHNLVSSELASNIIETTAKTLIANTELAYSLPPIMLHGAPGIGKSTIVKSVAKKLGIGFVDVRLAQMERVDLAGLPSVENKTTRWNVPDFWPRDPESKGILFFDEITAAPSDVQVACYSLILDRCIPNSDYKLPDGWLVVAAGNRTEDRAVARPLSSALANRFSHYELEANAEDWIAWAVQNNIHPSVTGFIQYRPALLFKMEGQNLERGWPTPRSWERVSNIIPMFNNNEEVLRKVAYSLIGNNVGVEFMEFHRINKNFDNVLEMLTNPDAKIIIPERSDEKYALASAVSYLLWNGKTEDDDKLRVEGLFRIVMEMSSDFATMTIKNAILGNKRITRVKAAEYITHSKAYSEFAKKFGKSFSKKYEI